MKPNYFFVLVLVFNYFDVSTFDYVSVSAQK